MEIFRALFTAMLAAQQRRSNGIGSADHITILRFNLKGGFAMNKFVRVITITVFAFALYACGGVHHRIATQPQNIPALKQVKLLPVEVSSKEQNSDALSLNDQWKKIATDELQTLLDAKNIMATNNSDTTVGCRIDVVYGSRALRYFVGFGAGAGHMRVTIELKDKHGTVLYAMNSEADLAMGGWRRYVASSA
jgi:hypothetical protein